MPTHTQDHDTAARTHDAARAAHAETGIRADDGTHEGRQAARAHAEAAEAHAAAAEAHRRWSRVGHAAPPTRAGLVSGCESCYDGTWPRT